MKSYKIVFIAAMISSLYSNFALASGGATGVGGGGKGVVCRNPDNSIKSVELLDLWESTAIHLGKIVPLASDVATAVDIALKNLADGFPLGIWTPHCEGPACLVEEMKVTAEEFLSQSSSIVRMHGVKLQLTNDSLELAQPENCEIEQIVNYQPEGAPTLLNQDLFDKMDDTNKAALIAHEAFYKLLRMWVAENNSLRTRRAVGFVFSGEKFKRNSYLPEKDGGVLCVSNPVENTGIPNQVFGNYFQFSPDFSKVQFGTVFGTPLIGTGLTIETGIHSKGLKEVLSKCHTEDLGISVIWPLPPGPVEYDRSFQLSRTCKGGRSITLYMRAPGEQVAKSQKLECRVLKKKTNK